MKNSAKYEIKMLLQNRGVSDDVIKTILEHDYLFDHVIEDILDTIEGEFHIFANEHENELATKELEELRKLYASEIKNMKDFIKDRISNEYVHNWDSLLDVRR